ncbi:MAG: A/G-specific adenine glycosylase [Actinomycetota bacterium]
MVSSSLQSVDLTTWFAANGRDLPWRRTRDPWPIVVAEMMLQQTQVARVIERWYRFLDRFPTVAVCAAAPVGEVIDEWSGLGYNRRAVFLHRMAVAVTVEHGGRFPEDLKALLALPGIGPYTARAVRAFAFEQPAAVLDTNVARILARTSGRTLGRREAQDAADDNLGDDPWTWNQAILDVGAGWCTASDPSCGTCPFCDTCAWAHAGRPEPDPARGSAGVSGKQSRFAGSDRQGRGKLVAALRSGPVAAAELATVMGWPTDPDRAARVAATLVADGLAVRSDDRYHLPT